MGLKDLRHSWPWKLVGDIADVHWVLTGIAAIFGGLVGKEAYVYGKPLYLVLLLGATAFMILSIGLHYGWKVRDRFLERFRKYDLRTLKGRSLKLRDEMQAFLDSLGEQRMDSPGGETDVEWIARASAETGRRWNLLGHYFQLNCATEVALLFHHFGMLGMEENGLDWEYRRLANLPDWNKKEEEYEAIITALTKAAERPEAKIRIKQRPALLP